MSERIERFTVEGRPSLAVRAVSGDVRIVDGAAGEVVVRLRGRDRYLENFVVEQHGSTITIEPERGRSASGSVGIVVEVGAPAALRVRIASGDVTAETELAELSVDSASGDVRAGRISDGVRAKTASGDLNLGEIGGALSVASASGEVVAADVGRTLEAKVASGDVRIGRARGDVDVKSASGDLDVATFEGGDLNAKTLSGDVTIGVVAGRRFSVSFNSLSGTIKTDFPVADGGDGTLSRLNVKSMSGDIRIRAAAG